MEKKSKKKSQVAIEINTDTQTTEMEKDDHFETLFTKLFDKLSEKLNKDIMDNINKQFDGLHKKIDKINNLAVEAKKKSTWCENEIINIKSEYSEKTSVLTVKNDELQSKISDMEQVIEKLKTSIKENETLLEDQVNRSCRKTLIFKGIPEITNSKKETWEETKVSLSRAISKVMKNVSTEDAFNMIERCHRGTSSKTKARSSTPKPIFACFHSWKDSNNILNEFSALSRKKKSNGVFVDQKYGEKTTTLRNEALKERKSLKDEGKIVSGFVSYPAKLFVKYNQDQDYKLYKEFSYNDILE